MLCHPFNDLITQLWAAWLFLKMEPLHREKCHLCPAVGKAVSTAAVTLATGHKQHKLVAWGTRPGSVLAGAAEPDMQRGPLGAACI